MATCRPGPLSRGEGRGGGPAGSPPAPTRPGGGGVPPGAPKRPPAARRHDRGRREEQRRPPPGHLCSPPPLRGSTPRTPSALASPTTGAAPEGIIGELRPALSFGANLDRVHLPPGLDELASVGPVEGPDDLVLAIVGPPFGQVARCHDDRSGLSRAVDSPRELTMEREENRSPPLEPRPFGAHRHERSLVEREDLPAPVGVHRTSEVHDDLEAPLSVDLYRHQERRDVMGKARGPLDARVGTRVLRVLHGKEISTSWGALRVPEDRGPAHPGVTPQVPLESVPQRPVAGGEAAFFALIGRRASAVDTRSRRSLRSAGPRARPAAGRHGHGSREDRRRPEGSTHHPRWPSPFTGDLGVPLAPSAPVHAGPAVHLVVARPSSKEAVPGPAPR